MIIFRHSNPALHLARTYTGQRDIITVDDAYHSKQDADALCDAIRNGLYGGLPQLVADCPVGFPMQAQYS